MNKKRISLLLCLVLSSISSFARIEIKNLTGLDQTTYQDAFLDNYVNCQANAWFEKIERTLKNDSRLFNVVVMDQNVSALIAMADGIKENEFVQGFYGSYIRKEEVKRIFVEPAKKMLASGKYQHAQTLLNDLIALEGADMIALATLVYPERQEYAPIGMFYIFQEFFHAAQDVLRPEYKQREDLYYALSEVEGELANIVAGVKGNKPGETSKRMDEILKIKNLDPFIRAVQGTHTLTEAEKPLASAALTEVWKVLKRRGDLYGKNIARIKQKYGRSAVETITWDQTKTLFKLKEMK